MNQVNKFETALTIVNVVFWLTVAGSIVVAMKSGGIMLIFTAIGCAIGWVFKTLFVGTGYTLIQIARNTQPQSTESAVVTVSDLFGTELQDEFIMAYNANPKKVNGNDQKLKTAIITGDQVDEEELKKAVERLTK